MYPPPSLREHNDRAEASRGPIPAWTAPNPPLQKYLLAWIWHPSFLGISLCFSKLYIQPRKHMFYMFSNSAQFVHILDICSCFVSFNINRLIAVALVPSFSLIYNIPLYNCATIYLTSCWWAFRLFLIFHYQQCFYEHSRSCSLPVCLNLLGLHAIVISLPGIAKQISRAAF